jgi:hypothetical protein
MTIFRAEDLFCALTADRSYSESPPAQGTKDRDQVNHPHDLSRTSRLHHGRKGIGTFVPILSPESATFLAPCSVERSSKMGTSSESECPPRDAVPRPIKIQKFDGKLGGLAYALKTEFVRRVSYRQITHTWDKTRVARNTSDQALRVRERLELIPYLANAGLASRVFLLGARPTGTKAGY